MGKFVHQLIVAVSVTIVLISWIYHSTGVWWPLFYRPSEMLPSFPALHDHQRTAEQSKLPVFTYQSYPDSIPVVSVRKDSLTGQPVTRGRIHLLRQATDNGKQRIPLKQFREILQCSPYEPELYGKGGALSLMQHLPVTKRTLQYASAFFESNCEVWMGCAKKVHHFATKGLHAAMNPDFVGPYLNGFNNIRMIRVTNGSLYFDWPWGISRMKPEQKK